MPTYIEYLDDCKRIQSAALSANVELTLAECQAFWEWRSKNAAAVWLSLPGDTNVLLNHLIDWLPPPIARRVKQDTLRRKEV